MEIATKHVAPSDMKFDDEAGTVKAVFATFGVKDSDGDVTLPGFFGKQEVAIAESHDRTKLVGKGVIYETDTGAVLEGKYFLDTTQGRESYLTAKNMGTLQELSYGFYTKADAYSYGEHNGEQVRFLTPTKDGQPGAEVVEVSTVLKGAGVGTHTVALKTEGSRFVDQAADVAKAAELLVARATEIQAMRAEKGKSLGDESKARLMDVMSRLEAVASQMGSVLYDAPAPDHNLGLSSARTVLAESQQLLRR